MLIKTNTVLKIRPVLALLGSLFLSGSFNSPKFIGLGTLTSAVRNLASRSSIVFSYMKKELQRYIKKVKLT